MQRWTEAVVIGLVAQVPPGIAGLLTVGSSALVPALAVAVPAGLALAGVLGAARLGRAAEAPAVAVPEQGSAEAEMRRKLRQARHDLRGALSPALLTADRLASSEDAAARRAGEIISRSIENAAAIASALRAPDETPARKDPTDAGAV